MKRELAALEETKSPVLDSTRRKTRASTRSSGVALSGSLVYKRVKKSQVKKAELPSNGGNVAVVNVSRASEAVSHPNGVHEARNESENGLLQVEKRENGVAAVLSSEVVKEVCDEGVKKLQESSAIEEKVVNGCSLAANDALPRNVIVMGVPAVNGFIKNAKSDVVELKSGSAVEEGATKGGSAEVGNELHANGGSIDVDKDKVVEGISKKSRLTVVNGNAKSSSVERHPRRFTRSALKLGFVENEPVTIEPNELAIVVYQSPESREEVKDSSAVKYTRRLTRSASKSKADGRSLCSTENVTQESEKTMPAVNSENAQCDIDTHIEEPSTSTPRRKLEMKMSKQISLAKKIPTNVQELFATGMLEGCPVYYDGGKGRELYGRIRGVGILCSCGICKGIKVIPPSLFEIHACNSYKRAVQYIYLENGRSLIQILKTCKRTRLDTLEATIKNAIGPLPEKKVLVCQNCKESFSTMEAGSSEPVCSTCVMSNLSPVGPVYSSRKRCRSPKIISPCQAASTCAMSQDDSAEKPVEKSPEAFCTPKLKTSQVGVPSDLLQGRRRSKSVEKSADTFVTPTLRRSSRFESISETKSSEEIVKNPEEASMVPKTCSSPVLGSSKAKRSKKLKERSFKSALSTKPSKATRLGKSSPENDGGKATERLKKEILTPKPSKTPSVLKSSEKKTNGKITRKDLRLHKLVFEDDVLPEGTELGYYARGKKLLDGFKKGSGIYCNCCDTVVSASQFEAHAGCASRRKPYCYIYTSNGVSLHELSVTLIKDRRHTAKYNDDLCSICADGGSLLLCDGCPRAFHKECASLPSIPVGKWYCKYCQNMFEREKFVAHNANAVAAGRVSGVDSIEQINKRSIRIVNNLASEVSACILCRAYDFCKSGFGPRTIILCDQCEKEYHVGCLKDHNMADLTELPEGKWFCNMDCGRIESSLQNLLVRGVEKLPESFLDIIRKKSMQISSDSGSDLDVRWRLLSGKVASPETRTLLSQAVAIFHESFSPIIDVVSGHDLIPAMVYGRNVGGQEYGGMYCAVLTVNSVVVSAGIFRIFGPEIVEIPLVATSSGNHGKGYFQILFACIEKLLAFLKIKTIVLPAAEEAGSIWTDRFGFTKMTADELCELKKNFWSIVRFQGTSMLHKLVPQSPVTES